MARVTPNIRVHVTVLLVTIATCVSNTKGYSYYRDRIPNGYSVPHPCKAGSWNGVGHRNEAGAGTRNPFGVHFAANGRVSNETAHACSVELCN